MSVDMKEFLNVPEKTSDRKIMCVLGALFEDLSHIDIVILCKI